MTNFVSRAGGRSIPLRSTLDNGDALDRLLAGLAALVFPLLLSNWLLHVVAPTTVEERVRLTLINTAAPSDARLQQPLPPGAPDMFQTSAGDRPAMPDPALAAPTLGSHESASIELGTLKLGVPEMSLPLVASTTQRNIAGTEQTFEVRAKPKVRLSLGDSTFFGRLIEAQRSGDCADLLNRLRSSEGGPSIDVILASLRSRGCNM